MDKYIYGVWIVCVIMIGLVFIEAYTAGDENGIGAVKYFAYVVPIFLMFGFVGGLYFPLALFSPLAVVIIIGCIYYLTSG